MTAKVVNRRQILPTEKTEASNGRVRLVIILTLFLGIAPWSDGSAMVEVESTAGDPILLAKDGGGAGRSVDNDGGFGSSRGHGRGRGFDDLFDDSAHDRSRGSDDLAEDSGRHRSGEFEKHGRGGHR